MFVGGSTHIEEVKKQLGGTLAATVLWKSIPAPGPGVTYGRRFVGELKIIWQLLRALRLQHPRCLFLTSSYPSTLLAAKLIERLRVTDARLQAVLHGGLSGVGGRRHRHPIRRLQEMRTALTLFKHSKMQYVVLEDSIREVLVRDVPALVSRVEVLEHPVAPNEGGEGADTLQLPIRFGFLGVANADKGFPAFLDVARDITRDLPGRAEFHAIGRWGPDSTTISMLDGLATMPQRERLGRAEFIRGVRSLHYVVLPHQATFYDTSATGTLLDAIAFCKPVIARKIPVFEKMFARHGDIGWLFDDDRELKRVIDTIVAGADQPRYRNQVRNMLKAQASRTPAALAARYREIRQRPVTVC
jgi:glycosyltransferase involved in cell wall biosynthesis